MTYEQYWEGDPYMVGYYQKADRIKWNDLNQQMWIQGAYIYEAIGTVAANMMSKKSSKKHTYLEKPLRIFPKTPEEIEAEAAAQRKAVIEAFSKWQKAWEQQKGQENGRGKK